VSSCCPIADPSPGTATTPPRRAPLPVTRVLIALLAVVVLLSGGCRRKAAQTPAPPPPPPPDYLALGDTAYAARDYHGAVEAYQSFLNTTPQAPERDRALFRVAMSYFVKESPLYDSARALEKLSELAVKFPSSPYAAEANLYLTLHNELNTQQQVLMERSRRIEELSAELARLKQEESKKVDELARLKSEAARREERIRQVSAELERLKAIDMQRKPSAPRR
jgi:hypothetical protein